MAETLESLASALADRYTVERELGRGGMATVFAATDRATGKSVAVKVLNRDLTTTLGPSRFQREIEIASSLTHPNILPVLGSGEAAGSLYFVMPLVTGESLHARAAREGQLPIDEAVAIVREVASALAYAHERGVVHRDIKPENILLQDGRALVADFGIARASAQAEKLTQTGMTLGTPAYMSPEQAAAEKHVDGRSDQYSLACVLYEILAGAPPYVGPTAQALMARHALESIPSVRIVRESVPEQIEDAIYRALSKNPVDRFATVAEFGAALGTPDTWEHPMLRRRAPRPFVDRRRSRLRRAVYSVALTLPMVAAGAAAWYIWLRPPTAIAGPAEVAARHVAVLYFDDHSAGGQLGYLADGLTEGLITELSQIGPLDVVSKNGVLPYRNADVTADSVGRALDVGTIVRGSVEATRGGGVQVTVRLVDGTTGEGIGRAATFRQPGANMLALRDSLSVTVAEFLRARIGEEVRLHATRAGTRNVGAWTMLQRAERTRKAAEAALAANHADSALVFFTQADSLLTIAERTDPRWGEPSVQRGAIAYRLARISGSKAEASKWIDRGMESAERALQRHPQSAGGFEYRGTLRYLRYLMALEPDPRRSADLLVSAEKDLQTAVRLDRTRATAFNTLSHLNYQKPDILAAKIAARQAYEADAYFVDMPKVMWRLYTTSLDLQQFDDAGKYCAEGRKRFPQDPHFVTCNIWQMAAGAEPANVDSAWRLLDVTHRLTPDKLWAFDERQGQMLVGAVIARAGLADSSRRVLLRARADSKIDPQRQLLSLEAYVRILLGEQDEAVGLVREYLSTHPEDRATLAKNQGWMLKGLFDNPEYRALLGLPDSGVDRAH